MKNRQIQTTDNQFLQEMIQKSIEGSLTPVLEHLLNQMMLLQREFFLGAGLYERNELREGYANGYKPLTIKSPHGKFAVQVPQVRSTEEPFRPTVLDCFSRAEKAFRAAIAEMYINGVSTRKVSKIIESLWPEGISSGTVSNITKELDESLSAFRNRQLTGTYKFVWLDAQYEKVRQDGIVKSFAVLIAIGLNENGEREVLGVSGKMSEAEIHWREFLESLMARGLKGVELIISDDHYGLKAARQAVLPATPWQRCFFHLQQNAQSKITNVKQRKEIGNDLKSIFSTTSITDAKELAKKFAAKWEKKSKKISEWLEDACNESFTYFKFEDHYWKKIRTSNPLERLNKEIKRRTKVVSIFPSEESCIRLISAILVEANENWSGRCYIKQTQE
jgi:putative transposase